MAITDNKKKIEPYVKSATGYIKYLLSSDHVVMDNGKTLQEEVNALNSNLIYEFGKMTLLGTPKGCNATVSNNSWYMRIGKMVTIVCELELKRTGSAMSPLIEIPVLPYPSRTHSTFVTGYQKAVIKANGTEPTTVTKAAAYGNSNTIYFVCSSAGRTWSVYQGELVSDGAILISGSYFVAD